MLFRGGVINHGRLALDPKELMNLVEKLLVEVYYTTTIKRLRVFKWKYDDKASPLFRELALS